MPALTDLHEAHAKHRDKFEILTFHSRDVKDFPELDEKLEGAIQGPMAGKPLPLPILLDPTGATFKAFGIRSLPTTLLIDPEGKLVGRVSPWELENKLPPLPVAEKLARALDRQVGVVANDPPLGKAVEALARSARVEIRLDDKSLKEAGISAETPVPLKLRGTISLRSAMNLMLEPHDLICQQGKDSLVVTRKRPGDAGPVALSAPQKHCVARINKTLQKNIPFDFKDVPLEKLVVDLERLTQEKYGTENFVLDPRQRHAGKLDSKLKVTGSARDVPFRQGLAELLQPYGLTFVVRDELIVLTVDPAAQRAAKK